MRQIVREHIVDVGMTLVRKEEAEKDHKNYAQQVPLPSNCAMPGADTAS